MTPDLVVAIVGLGGFLCLVAAMTARTLFQFLRVVFTLGMFIPAMWLLMRFVRPYTDAAANWLGPWVFVILAPAVAVSVYQGIEGKKPGLLSSLWRKRN